MKVGEEGRNGMDGKSRAELIRSGQLTDAGDNLGNDRLAWS
jgi:hypothetical protein